MNKWKVDSRINDLLTIYGNFKKQEIVIPEICNTLINAVFVLETAI